ncbi:hypothetical protein Q31b_49320 [Novipirellula aureliae]|uniref:Uncharacterized protein n=1 Tax=Novipirellula aureliae TaxID=2527966 RepID=A0A5C6DLY5_9BACT|nr:hypothetical protein [Novipirellula aureliae]TWU36651.1 hypothetical protein Q31b_49320 [Novipirellula aureliae]
MDFWDNHSLLFVLAMLYQRVAVDRNQIDELGLHGDFNPAKETSVRLKGFVERTGGKETWELESLPPEYLRDQVRAGIEANMDMATVLTMESIPLNLHIKNVWHHRSPNS